MMCLNGATALPCDFNAPDRCILSGIDSDDVFGKTEAKD